eukprot:344549-Chlamydomonas_euryale.AAC.1
MPDGTGGGCGRNGLRRCHNQSAAVPFADPAVARRPCRPSSLPCCLCHPSSLSCRCRMSEPPTGSRLRTPTGSRLPAAYPNWAQLHATRVVQDDAELFESLPLLNIVPFAWDNDEEGKTIVQV